MDLHWTSYLLAIVGGGLAGFINTLAGSGSLVTLPILVFLGLPANVANGTNRVGIVIQSIVGTASMRRAGALEVAAAPRFVLPTLAGALLGAWLATELSAQTMNRVIGVIMVIMLGVILSNPKRLIQSKGPDEERGPTPWWTTPLFFAIGVYGGFLQAGVGVMLLLGLVLGGGFDILRANALKILIALCFTVPALIIFALDGLVYWPFGVLVGVGQAIGAWAAVRFATGSERANLWTRRLLIAVVVAGIARFSGVWEWIKEWIW